MVGLDPIAGGDLARDLEKSLAEIREAMEPLAATAAFEGPSLSGGSAGIGLFLANLAARSGDESAAALAEACFDHAAETMAEMELGISFYAGIPGVPWAMDRAYALFEDDGKDDGTTANEAIDAAVLKLTNAVDWTGLYDLVSGPVGLGLYGLERLPHPNGAEIVRAVVAKLAELAERDEAGARWFTPVDRLPEIQRPAAPNGYRNIGVAHGSAGCAYFLGRAAAAGFDGAGELCVEAMTWIFAQVLDVDSGARMPAWVQPERAPSPSRLAWCYGDPGIAAALHAAALAISSSEHAAVAIELARHAAAQPIAAAGVEDSAICHGSSGLAHIYNHFFHATGDGAFADAARLWLADALARRRPEGLAGFASYEPVLRPGKSADPGNQMPASSLEWPASGSSF